MFREVLNTASDAGHGYTNSEEMMEAVEHSNGLSATKFFRFRPDRVTCVMSAEILGWPQSILRTVLNPYDFSISAFKHGGYGDGLLIHRDDSIIFHSQKAPKPQKDGGGDFEEMAIDPFRPSRIAELVAELVRKEDISWECVSITMKRCGVPAFVLNDFVLSTFAPRCSELTVGFNRKER